MNTPSAIPSTPKGPQDPAITQAKNPVAAHPITSAAIFVLVAAPVIALEASQWWASVAGGRSRASLLGLLDDITQKFSTRLRGTSAFIPAFIVVLALISGVPWPKEFAADAVPMDLVEKHLDLLSTGRLFASDQIADYLIFRNPRQKVFIDSRAQNGAAELFIIGGQVSTSATKANPNWTANYEHWIMSPRKQFVRGSFPGGPGRVPAIAVPATVAAQWSTRSAEAGRCLETGRCAKCIADRILFCLRKNADRADHGLGPTRSSPASIPIRLKW